MVTGLDTHEVFNQTPPLAGYDLFTLDAVLAEAVDREGARWARPELEALASWPGRPLSGTRAAGQRVRSEFRTHDRYGHRIDVVDYHPAYHELMRDGRVPTACMPGPGPMLDREPTWLARPR